MKTNLTDLFRHLPADKLSCHNFELDEDAQAPAFTIRFPGLLPQVVSVVIR